MARLRSPASFRRQKFRFVGQREVTFKPSNEGIDGLGVSSTGEKGVKSVSRGLRHELIGTSAKTFSDLSKHHLPTFRNLWVVVCLFHSRLWLAWLALF